MDLHKCGGQCEDRWVDPFLCSVASLKSVQYWQEPKHKSTMYIYTLVMEIEWRALWENTPSFITLCVWDWGCSCENEQCHYLLSLCDVTNRYDWISSKDNNSSSKYHLLSFHNWKQNKVIQVWNTMRVSRRYGHRIFFSGLLLFRGAQYWKNLI